MQFKHDDQKIAYLSELEGRARDADTVDALRLIVADLVAVVKDGVVAATIDVFADGFDSPDGEL